MQVRYGVKGACEACNFVYVCDHKTECSFSLVSLFLFLLPPTSTLLLPPPSPSRLRPTHHLHSPRKTSHSEKPTSRSLALSSFLAEDPKQKESLSKSTTLPSTRCREQSSPKHFNRPPNLALPGYPYCPPSPILTAGGQVLGSDHHKHQSTSATSKSTNTKRSLFRRRADLYRAIGYAPEQPIVTYSLLFVSSSGHGVPSLSTYLCGQALPSSGRGCAQPLDLPLWTSFTVVWSWVCPASRPTSVDKLYRRLVVGAPSLSTYLCGQALPSSGHGCAQPLDLPL